MRRLTMPRRPRAQRRVERVERPLLEHTVLSVADLVGKPAFQQGEGEVGRVADLVARVGAADHPPIVGVELRVGRQRAYVSIEDVSSIAQDRVDLRAAATVRLGESTRGVEEVLLAAELIDHQLVDANDVRLVRAADVYIARVGDEYRLVGLDVSPLVFLRRVGWVRAHRGARPEDVLDWAAVHPLLAAGGPVRLQQSRSVLERLKPSDLADLLEDLARPQRQQLLAALEPAVAADALEEMERDALPPVLLELQLERAAMLLGEMEPDEAAAALRDLTPAMRNRLMGALAPQHSKPLRHLLSFASDQAGGLMTTGIVRVREDETVAIARDRLAALHGAAGDRLIVVDADGRLVDDVPVADLLLAAPEATVGGLCAPPRPVTLDPTDAFDEVVDRFTERSGSALLVVDGEGRPLGRILADDLVEALAERERRGARRRARR